LVIQVIKIILFSNILYFLRFVGRTLLFDLLNVNDSLKRPRRKQTTNYGPDQ